MVLTGMDEKGPLRPTWQDATVDWLCDRSECSVNQRTWGVLDGLNIALKIKIVENTEEQTPKFSHKTWVSCFFLQVTKPMKLHLELRAAVLMEIGTRPPSLLPPPACFTPLCSLRHLWAFRFSGLSTRPEFQVWGPRDSLNWEIRKKSYF